MAFNQNSTNQGGFRPSMFRPKPSTVLAEKEIEYQQQMTNPNAQQPGQHQSNRQRKKNKNKQKDEARESIASYESKKQNDPNFKDLKLSTFATEWIEIVRKNISGDLTDFEKDLSSKIIRALVFKEDVQMLDSTIKEELASATQGGILLSTALRLLKTASSTQKMKDFSMTRLTEEIPNMEIPNFLNVVLSNIGKFSDDTYGNFRINSPVTTAKNRILKAMSATSQHLNDAFVAQKGKKQQLDQILKEPGAFYIYQDSDALDALKSYSRMYYEDSLRHINLVVKDAQQRPVYYFSLPFINFEKVTKGDQIAYLTKVANLTEVERLSVDNADALPDKLRTVKGLRDACASCVLFQNLNESFLDDVSISLKDYDASFDQNSLEFIRNAKISDILAYLEFIYIGDVLTVKDIIKNARTVYNFYIDRSLPYIKKNFKTSALSNSEFGTRAQLIEKKMQEYDTDRVEFSAISKFKENDLNVLGGLFGYIRNIRFKRAISQTLSASSDTILSSMVKNDLKY
jgi:ribosomal protein S18